MARVSVEQIALTDSRFTHLGLMVYDISSPDQDDNICATALGIGVMVHVWNECQERGCYRLDEVAIDAIGFSIGIRSGPGLSKLIVRCDLGEPEEGQIRIRGTEGRIEWRQKQREANAIRQRRHRDVTLRDKGVSNALVTRESRGAPTPTPTPTVTTQKTTLSYPPQAADTTTALVVTRKPRTKPDYSDGFKAAWAAYPHYGQRSKKKKAWAVWCRDRLDPLTSSVLGWIQASRAAEDWKREEGMFVPAMEVWLNGRDFTDGPIPQAAPVVVREIAPWQQKNRLLTDDEMAHFKQHGRLP